jgi:hypothetical protein
MRTFVMQVVPIVMLSAGNAAIIVLATQLLHTYNIIGGELPFWPVFGLVLLAATAKAADSFFAELRDQP